MATPPQPIALPESTSGGPWLARALGRIWLRGTCCKVRLLQAEALPAAGPAMLVLDGKPDFARALALVTALQRPVRCLLPEEACRGFWPQQLAARLGMILHGPEAPDRYSALVAAREALQQGEAVAVFAEAAAARVESIAPSCLSAARLAVEAEASRTDGLGLSIFPIFFQAASVPAGGADLLIYAAPPQRVSELLAGGDAEASLRALAGELENRLSDHPFRLEERDVQFFLHDLEAILRADLEADWAARPNWKQKTEGFELSRLLIECVEQLNVFNPPRLIALRIELEDYREQLRRGSLAQAEVEAAGDWWRSPVRRAWYWLESVAGFFLALYGLLNHLLPVGLFVWPGPLRKMNPKDPGQAWLLRALVVLGCYAAEVAFCAHEWGRAAAGYYTLTLPPSGLFLWRYQWLMKARMRLVYLAGRLPHRAEQLRHSRKALLAQLNRVRDEYAEASQPARPTESHV